MLLNSYAIRSLVANSETLEKDPMRETNRTGTGLGGERRSEGDRRQEERRREKAERNALNEQRKAQRRARARRNNARKS